jgi:hypothetical protein
MSCIELEKEFNLLDIQDNKIERNKLQILIKKHIKNYH